MPLMDWDAYQTRADERSRATNAQPFVMDPTTMSGDRAQAAANLYGQSQDPTSAINGRAFREAARALSPEEMNYFIDRVRSGADMMQVQAEVADYLAKAKPQPAAPAVPAMPDFTGGLMGQYTGPWMPAQ